MKITKQEFEEFVLFHETMYAHTKTKALVVGMNGNFRVYKYKPQDRLRKERWSLILVSKDTKEAVKKFNQLR